MRIKDRERQEIPDQWPQTTLAPWVKQPESAKRAINGNTKRAMIAKAAKRIDFEGMFERIADRALLKRRGIPPAATVDVKVALALSDVWQTADSIAKATLLKETTVTHCLSRIHSTCIRRKRPGSAVRRWRWEYRRKP